MDDILDVLQVGYGPVGQMHAAKLGRMGHRVAAYERFHDQYKLSRAGHFDHEVMRFLQSIDCATAVAEDAFPMTKYEFRNAVGETLITLDWDAPSVSGWKSDYLFYQPYMEAALDHAARASGSVEVHRGWEAIALVQHADHVALTVRRTRADGGAEPQGEQRTVKARYLVGADGANSFVRKAVGPDMEDFGFRENWLVGDFKPKRPLTMAFDNGQICDPKRPMCLFQLGLTHRRFEFMVMPGDDLARMQRPEALWELVNPWITPDDADLIRQAVYTFQSKLLANWRHDRVLLIGDATHLMPPFMGQGMCSGMRDATNLAWKLDLVLRGIASDALLDTYTLERKPHVHSIIKQSTELGRVSCTIDPEVAAARDAAFRSGPAAPPPFPWIEAGIVLKTGSLHATAVAGRLGPQARVRSVDGREGLCDDFVGTGWHLIGLGLDRLDLDAASRALIDTLRIATVAIDATTGYADVDNFYARYFGNAGLQAVIVRPDFVVYGGVESLADVDSLLASLAADLELVGQGQSGEVSDAGVGTAERIGAPA